MTDAPIVTVMDLAVEKVLEFRAQEPGDAEYGLLIEITGNSGNSFAYDLSFVPVADREPTDEVHRFGELPVIVGRADIENMRGASLDVSDDPENPSLVMNNPNTPSPAMPEIGELEGTVEERVKTVLEDYVNPAIAMHGGAAELVEVSGSVAYLRLMGGCQGCGMAAVTLRQGIESAVLAAVPEITSIEDVTDHASGTDPYYQAAKK